MTAQELDDIAKRLEKGWVVRRDQIEALIAIARQHLAAEEIRMPSLPAPTWHKGLTP